MCPNATAIYNGSGLIDLLAKRFEDAGEVTVLRPIVEPIVDALPRPESLGQITPRDARLSSVQNCVDELPIAELRYRPALLFRKNGLQSLPLLVAQRMSVHHDF